jgi:pimeloyl-ACP methyl ester carboxylesterase
VTPLSSQTELHGDPSPLSRRLVFIMGLNNSSFAWQTQVDHFASLPGYQVLVHDNRGVGNSDSPKGLYKTSEMARDVEELLDYVGWKEEKSLHVIGVSMGGMVALELVSRRLRPSFTPVVVLTPSSRPPSSRPESPHSSSLPPNPEPSRNFRLSKQRTSSSVC